MFEKEAEEYANEKYGTIETDEKMFCRIDWQRGAEFGYNKANEWHYVKDGLPTKDGRYLICNIFSNNHVATNIAEFNSSNRIFGCIDNSTIIAWKEIVLPELKESEKL